MLIKHLGELNLPPYYNFMTVKQLQSTLKRQLPTAPVAGMIAFSSDIGVVATQLGYNLTAKEREEVLEMVQTRLNAVPLIERCVKQYVAWRTL